MASLTASGQADLQAKIGTAQAEGDDTITFAPISLSGTLDVTGTSTSGSLTLNGSLTGGGAVSVSEFTGGNTATFSGALTHTGGFTVTGASAVTIGQTGSYNAAADVILDGGTFTNQGTVTTDGNAVTTGTNLATTIVNAAGARIQGLASGVIQNTSNVAGALTVSNAGQIQGTNFDGITQHGTGALTVTNAGTGVIYGQNARNSNNGYGVGSDAGGALTLTNDAGGKIVGNYGVVGSNRADTITNKGTIASGTLDGDGTITPGGVAAIQLRSGGTVTNQAGGVIRSVGDGIYTSGDLSLNNAGTVTGAGPTGVSHGLFSTGGVVNVTNTAVRENNQALTGGIITGTQDGINLQSSAGALTLVNSGEISATGVAGIYIGSNAVHSITNSGTLFGGSHTQAGFGINLAAGALTVVNQSGGTIGSATSGAGAMQFNTDGAVTVTLDQGSTVTGQILSENSGARTLVVNGALNGNYNGGSGTGVVNFTLGSSGTMQGATFGNRNDTFTYRGGTVGNTIDAGAGNDALVSALGTSGTGTLNQSNLLGFESNTQQSGRLTLTGTNTANVGWQLQGGTLNLDGTLSTSGQAVGISTGTTLRVATGGLISNTSGPAIGGNGTFTIVNAGTIRNNGDGSNAINTGATVTLLNSGTISTTQFVAANTSGDGSQVTNARDGRLAGGTSSADGIGINLGNNATIANYGVISGSATLANNVGTLTGGTGTLANLYAGSSTGTVRLGDDSTLSRYTGTGTSNVGVTTIDPVTGQTVTLQSVGANAAATVGAIALGARGTLALRGTGDGTTDNGAVGALAMSSVSGATTLNKLDTGTFVLTGGYGSALATNVTAGTLNIRNAGALGTTGSTAVSSGATLQLQNTIAVGAKPLSIAGSGSGTANGALQNVSDANTYEGALTLTDAARINVDSGSLDLSGGITGSTSTRALTLGGAAGSGTVSSEIGDNIGEVTKDGANTWTLSGTNTHTGTTTISAGKLIAASSGALGGVTSGTTVANGANLTIASAAIGAEAVTLNGGAALTGTGTSSLAGTVALAATSTVTTADALTLSGVVSGVGGLTKAGAGTLTLTGSITNAGIDVGAGAVVIGDGATVADGATLRVSSTNASLRISRAQAITLANIVSGSGRLEKTGSGTTTLTGNSTAFTGTAAITAGTLAVNGTLGDTTANRAAVINVGDGINANTGILGGSGTIAGAVNILAGGTISAGNSPGTLSTGNLTLATGATLTEEITGTAAGAYDRVNVTGSVSLAGTLDLRVTGTFANSVGQNLVFINNDLTDTVTGRFDALRLNGSNVALSNSDNFSVDGRSYQLNYRSGDGNDVAIRDVTPAPFDPGPPGPTPGNDSLVGTAGADTISLGQGADTFTGVGGADLVYGNQGDDLIYGNLDNDTLYGGQDNDRVYGGQGDDRVLGNAGNDMLFGNGGNDVVYGNQGADVIYGNQGRDTLFGGQDSDTLFGGQDADIVYGNLGSDIVYGNQGTDILYGGQGNDVLYGGQGNDTLAGGLGDDILVGGLGADRYVFGSNSGRDLILGFNQADGDRIALGGQTYTVSSAQNGDALLTLSGGGVVDLAGIRADQVNASYFAA